MDIFKSNKMFFILMGVLLAALIASTIFFMMQKNNAKNAKTEMESKQGMLDQMRSIDPSKDHVLLLQAAKDNSTLTCDDIVKSLITWNDYGAEALSHADVVAFIRDKIDCREIKESTVRKWFDDKKVKSFKAPDGSYYVLRKDLQDFLTSIIQMTPSEDFPKELIDALRAAPTKVQLAEAPTIFMGELEKLQRQIEAFAEAKDVIIKKDSFARYLSFDKYLADKKPPKPEEDLIPLIKQRSAVSDIMFMLIQAKVFEIYSIEYLNAPGKERRGDFYLAYDFEIKFAATYPAIARFMNMVLDPRKHEIAFKYIEDPNKRSKDIEVKEFRELMPRNLFIVTDIMFKSEEAETEMSREAEYQQRLREEEDRKKREEEERKKAGTVRTTGVYNPYERGAFGTMGGSAAAAPRGATGGIFDDFKTYHEKLAKEAREAKESLGGRPPEHSILNVTMTVSFVDLMGDITGEAPQAPTAGAVR